MTEQTIGTILRQKREEKKITLDQVFQAIKIRVNYLQALENDQLDQIPSRAQARGFIRLYANYLGLDPYALLEPPTPEITAPEAGIAVEFQEPEPAETPSMSIKEKFGDIVKNSSGKIGERFSNGADILKGSIQRLTDKIPFKLVRKDQPESSATTKKAPPPNQTVKQPEQTNKAMSRAIGDDLRKARETLGLSLADVERQIRIREFYLFAIEEGNLDALPSTVQGRGMLSNYASFLNLDSENILSRFAEVLQQRRLETLPESKAGVPMPDRPDGKQPIFGLKRLVSPDLIFTGGIFLVFFVFIIWGVFQLLGVGAGASNPTVVPISDVLLSSGTPTTGEMVVVETGVPTSMIDSGLIFTPQASQEGTQTASVNDPIQLTIAANRRAFMQITVDGKEVFLGRVIPGDVYTYSGKSKISLLCGDASAISIYYNQTNLGVMGIAGQVVKMDFTAKAASDLTANYTATPTVTQIATLTPNPTSTPTETPANITQTPEVFVTDTP